MQETVKRFKDYLAKMHAYDHAMAALNYDSETAMPKKGAADMAKTMGGVKIRPLCEKNKPAARSKADARKKIYTQRGLFKARAYKLRK